MRTEVAKILRFYGFATTEAVGGPLGDIVGTRSQMQPVARTPGHKLTKIIYYSKVFPDYSI
ncbi:MAG: hypothetical protein KAU16_06185 [Methanophagales archaeon]|nr:hypothetical protein [Methanophagales archaeon]